jgi:hypothetical protein
MAKSIAPDWWAQVIAHQSATIGPKWRTDVVASELPKPSLGKRGTSTGGYILPSTAGSSLSHSRAIEELSSRKA